MTEDEKALMGTMAKIEHVSHRIHSLETLLEKTNAKLDKLTEATSEMRAFSERLKTYDERIKSLESTRWWLVTVLVGGVLAAVLKTVMR